MTTQSIEDEQFCILVDHWAGFLIKNGTRAVSEREIASTGTAGVNVCPMMDELPNGNRYQ